MTGRNMSGHNFSPGNKFYRETIKIMGAYGNWFFCFVSDIFFGLVKKSSLDFGLSVLCHSQKYPFSAYFSSEAIPP